MAQSILQELMDDAKKWRKGKRWLYEKEITAHRLCSGFSIPDVGQRGAVKKQWEFSGFIDELRALKRVVRGKVLFEEHERRIL